MKAISLNGPNTTSRAPDEWREIPEIKEQRPSPWGQENSLQRIDGTNVCVWLSNKGDGMWNINSDFFLIIEEQ